MRTITSLRRAMFAVAVSWGLNGVVPAQEVELVADVDGQPLGANVTRVLEALTFLGAPLPEDLVVELQAAARKRDAVTLQKLLDPQALFVLSLNPEVRVKVQRGPGKATLQQAAFTPLLVKVINDSTVSSRLRIKSPQAGPVYSGSAISILKRQAQTELKDDENLEQRTDRFLSVEMFDRSPLTPNLSGLKVEYAVALVSSSEAGQREATIEFDVGAGTQDIGFRGEVPVLFNVKPAVRQTLSIREADGTPTTARITIRDRSGRVYPSQAKRLAPDFFFQPHIYRADGEAVLLPPGEFLVEYCRGPEYRVLRKRIEVAAAEKQTASDPRAPLDAKQLVELKLTRWVDARE